MNYSQPQVSTSIRKLCLPMQTLPRKRNRADRPADY